VLALHQSVRSNLKIPAGTAFLTILSVASPRDSPQYHLHVHFRFLLTWLRHPIRSRSWGSAVTKFKASKRVGCNVARHHDPERIGAAISAAPSASKPARLALASYFYLQLPGTAAVEWLYRFVSLSNIVDMALVNAFLPKSRFARWCWWALLCVVIGGGCAAAAAAVPKRALLEVCHAQMLDAVALIPQIVVVLKLYCLYEEPSAGTQHVHRIQPAIQQLWGRKDTDDARRLLRRALSRP
jgi:hypothetical protein